MGLLILTIIQGPDKGKRLELPDHEPQLMGRSSEAMPSTDETISRRHCELTPDNGRWYLRDLDSSNGTYVNGIRVTGRRRLEPGDQIRTGNTMVLFGIEASVLRRDGVHGAGREEIDISVESVVRSSDESMIMAVPEPSEAAVVQLRIVYELTRLIGEVADRDELLGRVMGLIFTYFKADRGVILLKGDPDEPLDPIVVRHRVEPMSKEESLISYSRTIVQHVLTNGEGILSTNAMSDERFAGGDSVQHIGIRSAVCVPIRYRDQTYGLISLDSQVINYTFTDDQLRLLTAIGVHTGLALANAQLYAAELHRERLAVVGQTVASLSHSIRNIIQGLRGGADVVEMGLRKESLKVVNGGWNIVSRNLDRIFELTMNMLAYSKQRKPELEVTNLNTVIEEAVDLVQKQYDRKDIALLTDLDPGLPPLPIDSTGIHQGVLNLLNNGLDACETKKGAVTVRSQYVEEPELARITITDNGTGISAETRKVLFEPFHSTKGLRGTGLGLVVTKKIIDEHQGSIRIQSKPGRGTTFTIDLPFPSQTAEAPTLADTQGPAMP